MINKHGKDCFDFEILELVEPTKEKLEEREQYYLDTLKPFPWNENSGFNLSPTAYTPLGIKRSDDTRKKMRESWHESRDTKEYKRQLRDRILGDKNPTKRADVRAKISKSMTGKTWKDDHTRVEKHRIARIGKKHTEETRINMKKAQQKNKTRSAAAKEIFYLAQRKLYEIENPNGYKFKMYSRELKIYCVENRLTYANLIGTVNTGKRYKGGWLARLVG